MTTEPNAQNLNRRMPRPDAVANRDARRDDAQLPAELRRAQTTRLPVVAKWCRQVDSVHPTANNIHGFAGKYLENRCRVHIGDVCILCTEADERLLVFIVLPDGLWYRTQRPALRWETGWARLIRDHVRDWVSLSKAQRVIRACNEMVEELSAARQDAALICDQESTTCLNQALEHTESIIQRITGDVTELTEQLVMRSFNAWANSVAVQSRRTRDDVLNTLNEALEVEHGPPEPQVITIRGLNRLVDILGAHSLLDSDMTPATTSPIRAARQALATVTRALQTAERRYVEELAAMEADDAGTTTAPERPTAGLQRLARNIRLHRRR